MKKFDLFYVVIIVAILCITFNEIHSRNSKVEDLEKKVVSLQEQLELKENDLYRCQLGSDEFYELFRSCHETCK